MNVFLSHLPELMIVLVVAMVIFGPKRLPDVGASLGKGIREFRTATRDMQESVTGETQAALPATSRPATASEVPWAQPVGADITTPALHEAEPVRS